MNIHSHDYAARTARSAQDMRAVQLLRFRAFRGARLAKREKSGTIRVDENVDSDDFDDRCQHIMVESQKTGNLMACVRLQIFENGLTLSDSYASQFYDLSPLISYPRPLLEVGRFCTDGVVQDPHVVRLIFGAIVRVAVQSDIAMLFGCSSFPGVAAHPYRDAFDFLASDHLAPSAWMPTARHPGAIDLQSAAAGFDRKAALRAVPSLLRTYLTMGARVSGQAVVDHDLSTIHVFTGLEVKLIPHARSKQLLRLGH